MKNHKHLVVGLGQIGTAIKKVLSDEYYVKGIDENDKLDEVFQVMHVCIPGDLDNFVELVEDYQERYLPDDGLTVIHSTVPVGTSDKLGAVHSPVRGVHPDLESGVRTFVKFFGGERSGEASKYFRNLGINCVTTNDARNTEAMKLWSTTQYGLNIILEKEIMRYCQEHDLDFEIVYEMANKTYNEGYLKLNKPQFLRYVLEHIPGEVGGHCVLQNTELFESWVCDLIQEKNDELSDV